MGRQEHKAPDGFIWWHDAIFSPLPPLQKGKQHHTVLLLALLGLWYHPNKDVKMKRGKCSHADHLVQQLAARTVLLTRMATMLIRKEMRKTPMP